LQQAAQVSGPRRVARSSRLARAPATGRPPGWRCYVAAARADAPPVPGREASKETQKRPASGEAPGRLTRPDEG